MKRFLVSLLLVLLIVSPTRAAPLDSVPASGKLSFAIWREGNRIGSHRMTFRREGTTVTVEVRVDIVVQVALITLYRYTGLRIETWRDGVLQAFAADTDDDGKPIKVRARVTPEGLLVEGPRGATAMPPNAQPFTLWSRAVVEGAPVFSMEDGAPLQLRAEDLGLSPPPRGNVPARHFRLSGDLDYELWFNGATLAGVRLKGRDGSMVEYVVE